MDVLTDILQSAGVERHLLVHHTIARPWAMRFPCEQSMGFYALTQGQLLIRSAQLAAPLVLGAGDFLLMARGFAHEVATDLTQPALPPPALDWDAVRLAPATDVAPLATLACGVYQFRTDPVHPFFHGLPPVILLRGAALADDHPLHLAMDLLRAELAAGGGATGIVTRSLTDLLFAYLLRHWLHTTPDTGLAWARALKDPKLAPALAALHGAIAQAWSVDALARRCAMSRTAFAQRFRAVTGDTPIRYLSRLRVQRALPLLQSGQLSHEQIAERLGFGDVYSFSKVFKRICGLPPGAVRKPAVNSPAALP